MKYIGHLSLQNPNFPAPLTCSPFESTFGYDEKNQVKSEILKRYVPTYLMFLAFILQNNHKFYLILKTCVEHQRRFLSMSFHSSGGQPSYLTPWKMKGKTHGFSGSLLSLVVRQFILWA